MYGTAYIYKKKKHDFGNNTHAKRHGRLIIVCPIRFSVLYNLRTFLSPVVWVLPQHPKNNSAGVLARSVLQREGCQTRSGEKPVCL